MNPVRWTLASFDEEEVEAFLKINERHRLLADKALRYSESKKHARKELQSIEDKGGVVVLGARANNIVGIIAYRLRQWDADLFGYPVASIDHLYIKKGDFEITRILLEAFDMWAKENKVRFAFAKAPWQIENAKAITESGFYLVEAAYNLTKTFTARDETYFDADVRTARKEELARLLEISAHAGWPGRFHADPQIGEEKAREAYARWLAGGFEREDASVTVLDQGGGPIGFVLWSVEEMVLGGETVKVADWELSAVAKESQAQGVGSRLYRGALEMIRSSGARHVTQGVSVHNAPALNICTAKIGFRPNYQTFVYHKFF